MRIFGIIFIVFSTVLFSCSKTDSGIQEDTYIKLIEAEGDYLARNSCRLNDGGTLVFCTGLENKLSVAEYGNSPSFIIKFDEDNNLVWRKTISNTVFKLWAGLELSNGNIFVAGYDEAIDSQLAGFLVFDKDGNQLFETSFINQSTNGILTQNSPNIDALELRNGNIAVVFSNISAVNQPLTPRLVIFDKELNILIDNKYAPGPIILSANSIHQIKLFEDVFGNLFMIGRPGNNANATLKLNVIIYRFSSGSYVPQYRKVLTSDSLYSTSNLVLSNEGHPVWAHMGPNKADSASVGVFNIGDLEDYFIGKTIFINKLDIENDTIKTVRFNQFPRHAFLKTIKKTNDGGFILAGSCNININLLNPSEVRLLLIKVDSNLNIQWYKTPVTLTSLVGWDVLEVKEGYLITGTHINLSQTRQPFLMSLDKNGQLN